MDEKAKKMIKVLKEYIKLLEKLIKQKDKLYKNTLEIISLKKIKRNIRIYNG